MRHAGRRKLDGALDGLERVVAERRGWRRECAGGAGARTSDASSCPRRRSELLRDELGLDRATSAAGASSWTTCALPPSRLGDAARQRARRDRRGSSGADDHASRVAHAAGRSYPDLVRLRSGDAAERAGRRRLARPTPPSARRARAPAPTQRVAVVPFGGGTSVVGGVEAAAPAISAAAIALDLGRHGRRRWTSTPTSLTATLEAGLLGPALEAASARHGLTLGHFPQSFEYSTVGGWVATRSAGQASTGYGRIDELVRGPALRDARQAS